MNGSDEPQRTPNHLFDEAARHPLVPANADAKARAISDHLHSMLSEIIDGMTRIEDHMRETILTLSRENATLRKKELDTAIRWPELLDIIEVIDRLDDEIFEIPPVDLLSTVREARIVDREQYLEILRRRGVEAFVPRDREKRDPQLHEILETRPAYNPDLTDRIFRVLRPGYCRQRDGWIVRPARVGVWAATRLAIQRRQ